eukprot:CAMPEP_0202497666 /NCGR_PEP_ID=MMETSP1361-20130828/23486_1 /ASSEMBLY_ACC=CAM_ASM_000849 /TAXON_ID=210615 /ORGANISM="Staurosira complex sp., Strain CCMP2646" /LENGTH=235 /DNA_ID=CAMNT_0049129333 /DNA_START=120 /DNA_END=824 /DNA_ORIENTATION=-
MNCSCWNSQTWHMKAATVLGCLSIVVGVVCAVVFSNNDLPPPTAAPPIVDVPLPGVQLGFDPTATYNIAVAEDDTYRQSNWALSVDSTDSPRDNDTESNPQSYYAFVSSQPPAFFDGWSLQSNDEVGSDERFRIVAFLNIDNSVFGSEGWSLSAKSYERYERDQRDEESNFCFVHYVGADYVWKITESPTVPGRYRITFVESDRHLAAHRNYATDERDGTSTYAIVHDNDQGFNW